MLLDKKSSKYFPRKLNSPNATHPQCKELSTIAVSSEAHFFKQQCNIVAKVRCKYEWLIVYKQTLYEYRDVKGYGGGGGIIPPN
jgi:hypothetical protein